MNIKNIITMLILIPTISLAVELKDIKKETKDVVETSATYTKEQKENIQKNLEADFANLKKQIHELSAKIDKTSDDTVSDLKAELSQLQKKQNQIDDNLKKFKKTSGQAWNELKAGLDKAVSDLGESYSKAKEHLKENK